MIVKEVYGLNVAETHLPSRTTDQNIDILDLSRNIHVFVENYHYNLHTQVFMQESSETKQIKTVGVNQLLYSLRTHGYGLLGSTLEFLYKYMSKLFILISDFLIDEQINSPLLVESKIFKKSNSNKNQQEKPKTRFPYESALKIMKGI